MAPDTMILVWDINSETSSRLIRLLSELDGFQAVEYRSRTDTLDGFSPKRPCFMLLDVDYTVSDVSSAVRSLKSELPNLIILGITNQLDDASRRRFSSTGLDGLLPKSIDGKMFLRATQHFRRTRSTEPWSGAIAFFSPKGKSGRTTLIVNLAMALARASGDNVGVIDADTNFADLDTFLNLVPRSTIVEALRDLPYMSEGSLKRYFEAVSDKVSVLCGAKSPQEAAYIEPEALARLIAAAKKEFRYVLIDLPPGFSLVSVAAAEASDYIYLTAMAAGGFEQLPLKRSMEIFRSLKGGWKGRVSCVITRLERGARQQAALEDALGCPVSVLPNEYILCASAANNGRMAVDIGADSPLTIEIDRMAQIICQRKKVA